MNIYYRNLNINDTDGVTGSCNLLTIKLKDKENYNIIVDYGQIQNQKLNVSQLYKLNARNMSIEKGGDEFQNVQTLILSHAHS